jgi:hypothetical protein
MQPVDLKTSMSYTEPMTITEMKRALVLFFIAAAAFLYPTIMGQTLFVGDMTYSFQPWLTYAAQEIQSGRFPLWNPYSACGEPFVSNPQVMIFNPAAIVYWVCPFTTGNGLFLVISQSLLYLFTYFLARRWMGRPETARTSTHGPSSLAALGLAWGGFAVSHWEFPSAIGTLWSLPLFFLLGLGESWKALAVSWALTFFSGYTQFSYYAAVLAGAGAAHAAFARRRSARDRGRVFVFLTASTVAGILLALPQIGASWENARQSFRTTIAAAESGTHLLTPIYLLKLWIPRITNTVVLAFQERAPFGAEFWSIQRNWLATFFMGTPLCILGLSGFVRGPRGKTILLAVLVAVGATWSFGIDPFFGWSRTVLPGFRYLTHFANASIIIWLCLALASTNMAHPGPGRNFWTALITGGLLVPALGLALSPEARAWSLHRLLGITALSENQTRWVMQAGGTAATAVLVFVGTWLFFRHKRWAAMWAMTLAELWLFGIGLHPWGSASLYHRQPALARSLAGADKRLSLSPTMMKSTKPMDGSNLMEGYESVREVLYPNVPLPYRVHQTWSYEVFGITEFVDYRRRVPDHPGESAMLDFLGADPILSTTNLPDPSRFAGQRPNALLYRRPGALPRTTAVGRAVVKTSLEDRLNYLAGPWDPRREVVIESPFPHVETGTPQGPAIETDNPNGGPRVTRWSDGPGHARADGEGKGWLVRSETFYPGWSCWVNGRPVTIARANHAFQAVPVPEGQWTAWWRYRSPPFQFGLWVSILTGILGLGWTLWSTGRLPGRG